MLRTALLAPLVVALAASAVAAAGPSNPARSFRDTVADSPGAPDVTTVSVQATAGAVTFVVRTAAAAPWVGAAAIVGIDSDGDATSGDAGGARGMELSYVLHSEHDEFTLDRSGGESVQHPSATARLTGGTLTIRVPRAELEASGGPVGFVVSTPGPAGRDRAPDTGEWRFSPDATVRRLVTSFAPAAPAHGKRFALRSVVAVFSDGTSGTAPAACRASLDGVRLGASCRWRIPTGARGKKLAVVIRSAGLSTTLRFTVR